MREVRETQLPGVGVRHEFDTEHGDQVGVIVHRDGRREIVVYDSHDPDACTTMVDLSAADARTMAEILGVSQVTEAATQVQQHIEGLTIEWIQLPDDSPAIDSTLRSGEYRTQTGASIVAVIRGSETTPAPAPEFALAAQDVAVAVGTVEGLTSLRSLLVP